MHGNNDSRAYHDRQHCVQFALLQDARRHPIQAELYEGDDPLIGRLIRLDRRMDRERPCHANVAEICPGVGPHAYALRCCGCGQHRGWLPKRVASFFLECITVSGEVPRGLTLHDARR
jgi:hypothetical protein